MPAAAGVASADTAESGATMPPPDKSAGLDDSKSILKDFVGDEMRQMLREELARAFAEHACASALPAEPPAESLEETLPLELSDPVFGSGPRWKTNESLASLDPIDQCATLRSSFGELAKEQMTKLNILHSKRLVSTKLMAGKIPGGEKFDYILHRILQEVGTAEAPPRSDWVSQLADHWLFHSTMSLIIVINSVILWGEADDAIIRAGKGDSAEPGTEVVHYYYIEMVFLTLYTFELFVNIWRQRWVFFYGAKAAMNILDVVLVVLGVLSLMQEAVLPGSNALKILRVCKLIKALRVLRAITMVKTLRAILTSLVASISTLLGAFVMLALTLYMWSLLFVLGIANYFDTEGESVEEAEKLRLMSRYGSVHGTMVSLLKATTDSWSIYYDVLQPAGWVYQALFVTFVLFTEIALMNIILGLFVDQAMKSLLGERDDLAREHEAEERKAMNDILALFDQASTCHTGKISRLEWDEAIDTGRGKLHSYLHMLGFRFEDVNRYFYSWTKMSKDGTVDIRSFVEGCMSMRGNASHFDVKQLEFSIQELARLLRPGARKRQP